ncbi:MAG: hypothetical protein II458_00665 [Oscillospiraceae bacterium]|nr:hypothetical protein [Oscillospiraceae bacterium]
MAAKGYNRYRGRSGGGGRIAWIIALALVLLAAVAFLLAQRYVVYDEDGHAHWELPFGKNTGEETPANPISPEDVVIDREEPSEPEPEPEPEPPVRKLDELHAREIEYGSLWWTPEYVLSRTEDAMVIEVKRPGGGITYGTGVEVAPGTTVEEGVTRDNLVTLLQSEKYTVARLNFFADPSFARAHPDAALTTADGVLWYDASGRMWLDPGNEDVRAYLTALCVECAELGFNEILLDGFCYPATGDLAAIAPPAELDKAAVLADFAAALRKALPEDVALSVTLRGDMGDPGGDSGLTAELLSSFDRIYVAGEVNTDVLRSQLPASFDPVGGLVLMTQNKPQQGSYVLVP